MNINTIVKGNCLDVMASMPDDTVDLTVTSPPYDDMRDYKGYSFDFEPIAKELYRITKPGGTLVWVVADATKDYCKTLTSYRQALYFVDAAGFKMLDDIAYAKNNMPQPPQPTRYHNIWEHMFILTKGKPTTFNPIMTDRLDKSKRKKSASRQKDGSVRTHLLTKDRPQKRMLTNIWWYSVGGGNSATDKFRVEHPAIFPEDLAADHIKSWSNPGDLVFDPFSGSGTTLKMAKRLGRNFYGSEMSEEYVTIALKRLGQYKGGLDNY